jgi:predicted RNA-binding protein
VEIRVNRNRFYKECTIGQLYLDGELFCFTLEDVVREVEGQPVEKWKVFGETAIPQGKYKVTLENSHKFGQDTMTVNRVPGFASIRMHAGNTAKDTEGCLILGYQITPDGKAIAFGKTKTAVVDAKQRIRDAIKAGEEVWITIANVK